MKPTHHAIISSGFSVFLLLWLHSWIAGLACLLSGIFIDIDHFLDYYMAKKKIPFKYDDLLFFCSNKDTGNLYLIFHSYEFLILFWLFIYCFHLNGFLIGIAVGVTQHLICDQFANPLRPLGYFLSFRLKHGFERQYIFTKEYFQEAS